MNTDKPDAVEDPGKQWSEMYVKAWKFYCIENGEPESEDDRELAIDRVSDLASFGLQLTAENDRLKKEVEAAKLMIRNIAFYAEDHTEPGGHCALCVIQGVVDGGIALLPLEGDSK